MTVLVRRVVAILIAGLAGGAAWLVAMTVCFLPAQALLANPAYQSAKFLAVFGEVEPLPRVSTAPWILPAALIAIGCVHACVYAWIREGLGSGIWTRGVRFGVVAWALMAPWFEFYLPWNVMHEPAALVLLELALWAVTLVVVGVAIANVYERTLRRREPPRGGI